MAGRAKRSNSWDETKKHVKQAKQFTEQYDVHKSNPSEFLPWLPADEQQTWDNLLSKLK